MSGIILRRHPLPATLAAALILCAALVLVPVAGAQGKRCETGHYVIDAGQISDGSGAAGRPATDGSLVVWADDRSGDLDIYAYDVEAGVESRVRVAPGDQTDPVVAGGEAYWIDRSGVLPVVWTVDPATGGPEPVSAPGADELAASARYVVWSQTTGGDQSDIVALDRASGAVFTVCDAAGDQVHPAASDDLIAWEDHRGGEADVYVWDPRDDEEIPVSFVDGDQTTPAVYGTVVLWADDRSGDVDIYGADACDLWIEWAENSCTQSRGCDTQKLEFLVAGGDGDQVDPVVSGPMAYWTDLGCDEDGDVEGTHLVRGEQFTVAGGDGAQTGAASGDDGEFVAWLDAAGGTPVVAGGRLEWVDGDDGEEPGPAPEWTTEDVVTLFLSVLTDLGVFDEVRFAVDAGEYGEWQPLNETEAVRLPAHDGAHVIHIQLAGTSFDPGVPGSEDLPLELSITTTLDTHGPVTAARRLETRRGAVTALRVKVRDNLSPTAAVRVRIKNRAGKVVRVIDLGSKATGKLVSTRWKVDLRRGRYTMRVLARDLAGNGQRKAYPGVLIVR